MKTLLTFNLPDKPENIGQSQLFENKKALTDWMKDKKEFLPNAYLEGNVMWFDKSDEEYGMAVLSDVPDNFQN